jgi:hypothetical protein
MSPSANAGLVAAPESLAAELAPWIESLHNAVGAACRAVYLYGSALTPRFDTTSDVNLLIVAGELSQARLDALARVIAQRSAAGGRRVTPLALTDEQIKGSVDVFPLEFHDLAARRALLWGQDVLGGLRVGDAHLRHQCESELRAKLVGLRQAYILGGGSAELAGRLLVRAAGGTAAAYRGLLALRGIATPPEEAGALADAVAHQYGVDAAGLSAPFAAHRDPPAGEQALRQFAAYASALEALIVAVDTLPHV